MNQKRIVIDGKTYNSVNDMPPDVRARYEQAMRGLEDSNRDGFPDFVENAKPTVVTNVMKFIMDGKEYNSIEDLPPEARAKYEQAMGALDKNRNGVPDMLEGMMGMFPQESIVQNAPATQSPRPVSQTPYPQTKPQFTHSTIEPETSNSWMLALGIVFVLILCALGAAGVWYFFLR